ncbi:DUF397 domain-containing protein [Streptomyces sp. BB1-1-1]|uniref:DUF397 domain-containing protein n=1 Tax=Streptomyces sp. BB1-1-1 TaxID=3074430 RepID=UPI002877E991|nr:DUF397 domain-containing protein [Streptomyces sp. BB1-1-1]WND37692.1 DUF397 domain-containing protein [Streptomyces sp. BB1-1-1]
MREYDLSNARWTKSSYSNGQGGDCVEVADGVPGVVPVRDSKVAAGPVVVVGSVAWTEFVRTVGATRFLASVVPPRPE